MKRHLFSIVMVVLLLACASSTALSAANQPVYDASTGVYAASSTEKRNVFEFCDLFSSRLDCLKDEYSFDGTFDEKEFFDYEIFDGFNTFSGKDRCYAVLRAGNAYVNVPSFTIEQITFNLVDSYTDNDEALKNAIRLIASISALEYNAYEDYAFKTCYSINHKFARDASDSAINIYNENISPALSDPLLVDKIKKSTSANGLLVYSGRYNYYLDYYSSERENDDPYFTYELVAVAK